MLIHELTPAECRAVLERTHVGRLACARADQPYIVPILFSFDAADDCLYSFSMLGRKIDWMRDNPKVCLEVDEIARARELFEQRTEWWLPGAARLAGGEEHAVTVMYRVHVESVTGRRAARPAR